MVNPETTNVREPEIVYRVGAHPSLAPSHDCPVPIVETHKTKLRPGEFFVTELDPNGAQIILKKGTNVSAAVSAVLKPFFKEEVADPTKGISTWTIELVARVTS